MKGGKFSRGGTFHADGELEYVYLIAVPQSIVFPAIVTPAFFSVPCSHNYDTTTQMCLLSHLSFPLVLFLLLLSPPPGVFSYRQS